MEILFHRHDADHVDLNVDFWRLKDGDVYTIKPISWNWGTIELTSTNMRIVRAPNLTQVAADSFLEWDWTGKTEGAEENPTQIRKYTLNKVSPSLTQAFIDFWNDDTRAVPIYETSLPIVTLLSLRIARGV